MYKHYKHNFVTHNTGFIALKKFSLCCLILYIDLLQQVQELSRLFLTTTVSKLFSKVCNGVYGILVMVFKTAVIRNSLIENDKRIVDLVCSF